MSRVLLLVDDEPDITKVLRRMLKRSFDAVFTATSGEAAAEILSQNSVTHVVADHDLGDEGPKGATLVSRWRQAHPSIRFAAIFTGRVSTREIEGMPGINAAYAKPEADGLVQRLKEET
ncbi:MAG TPA: response regulator [Myxococcales bacterium]